MNELKEVNEAFCDQIDGPTLIRISFSNVGGLRDYRIVYTPYELSSLLINIPRKAKIDLFPLDSDIQWKDTAYSLDSDGTLKKGSY